MKYSAGQLLFTAILLFSLFSGADDFLMPGEWRMENAGKKTCFDSSAEKDKVFHVSKTVFPGGLLLYKEQPRYSFRPARKFFEASELHIEIMPKGPEKPLKAWIFCKDKDGTWFQSAQEFSLLPNQWNTLSVRLDLPGRSMLPAGHSAAWDGLYAGTIFAAGLSICTDEPCKADFSVKNFSFCGTRFRPETALTSWSLPEKGKRYTVISSKFSLSGEYFNPFDPDEIAVDFEVKTPTGKTQKFPAFYTIPYKRTLRFTQETYVRSGEGHWQFRYFPQEKGEYAFRLLVCDRSGKKEKKFVSPWKKVRMENSSGKGALIVSKANPRYFEFMNGDFFFPVGINIHTNTDQRSENAFGFGHLPDRGNTDYEEYLEKLSGAGMNLMEVWMAAWTYALEWSSSRAGYSGLGRYNMLAAYRLDLLLEKARKKGVCINLVLNNHGMLSESCDPEWYDSPFNTRGIFARANGALLDDPVKFWSDPKAIRYSKKRIRYICARWGALPGIFAMEQWSEVDLVKNGPQNKEIMTKWHKMASDEIKKQSSVPRLVATHVCGDIWNLLRWRQLTLDPKEHDHACCDAYRDHLVPIDVQIMLHRDHAAFLRKPLLITEYGGSSSGANHAYMLGDIHGGIWTSLFTNHAGTPLLWWHDFIHINDYYNHYRAFTGFVKGLDLRHKDLKFGTLSPSAERLYPEKPETDFLKKLAEKYRIREIPLPWMRALYLISGGDLYAWIYDPECIFSYPQGQIRGGIALKKNVKAEFPLPGGRYFLLLYDTLKEMPEKIRLVSVQKGKALPLDDFRTDMALKLLRAEGRIGK